IPRRSPRPRRLAAMTAVRTHYQVLDVRPSASREEIRDQYRRLVRLLHPDRHVAATDAERKLAERRLREVTAAWAVIGDDEARSDYDRQLAALRATTTTRPATTSRPTSTTRSTSTAAGGAGRAATATAGTCGSASRTSSSTGTSSTSGSSGRSPHASGTAGHRPPSDPPGPAGAGQGGHVGPVITDFQGVYDPDEAEPIASHHHAPMMLRRGPIL